MLTCRRRCISSLVSAPSSSSLPSSFALRRTYSTTTARYPTSAASPPPPPEYRPKGRPLLDQIALTDPAKLAETVRRRLAQGNPAAAVELTRDGSRSMNSVVSWNHVIQHYVDKGEIKHALATYNQMKKRGTKPDSYTFTILLDGISNYPHFSQSLFRALRIYNSLSSPKSPVPANIIHTNAILKVCVRSQDLDSMWTIVGRLPMRGPNTPNALTYTTLLNGIYWNRSRGGNVSDVEDGRRVWAGVLSRWTKGQLWIDEELACAMGRVLLRGEREEDWKEVFALVEQVFGIKSLVAQRPPQKVTANTIYVENSNTLIQTRVPESAIAPSTQDHLHGISDVEKLFTPAVARDPSRDPASSTRPKPGNSTFSLILQACAEIRDDKAAFNYWSILTNPPFSVVPDLENYHDLLRIIRRFRSGTDALNVVQSMRVRPTTKTIYIALSACKRSGRSKNFQSAEQLLSIMNDTRVLPVDVKIWNMFLQCAIKSEDPAHIKHALRLIDENFDMRSELIHRRDTALYLDRALELLRAMIGAVDVLLNDGLKTPARWGHGERASFEERRKSLGTLLTVNGRWGVGRSYKADMADDAEEQR